MRLNKLTHLSLSLAAAALLISTGCLQDTGSDDVSKSEGVGQDGDSDGVGNGGAGEDGAAGGGHGRAGGGGGGASAGGSDGGGGFGEEPPMSPDPAPADEGGMGGGADADGEMGDPNTGGPAPPGGRDVSIGQGGAQDFGVFRRIIMDGGLPLPETLDDVGFFNEHVIDTPPADCGQAICLHASLGAMDNLINGAGCTMLQLGLNARVSGDQEERKPLNLGVAVDVSGSMRSDGKIDFVRRGLQLMLENLHPGDEVTLVAYSSDAHVIAEAVQEEGWPALTETIAGLTAGGGTNIHAGLDLAFDLVQRRADPSVQNRVILLSDGEPTVGITDEGAILEMASTYTLEGIGLTTIGVGAESNPAFLRTLSETGAGNFYFLENQSAIEEVFVEELNYFVTPIATDLRVEVLTGAAYELREVFGTRLWSTEGDTGVLEIPSVQIAHRMAHDDQEQGRRGGGGAILMEMMPLRRWQDAIGPDGDAGRVAHLRLSFLAEGEVLREEQTVEIRYPHDPDHMEEDGFFQILSAAENPEDYTVSTEKAFVMLNLYGGFRVATESVARGDLDFALITLEALEGAAMEWHDANHDEDIEDDLDILSRFIRNLIAAGAGQPDDQPEPVDPWPMD